MFGYAGFAQAPFAGLGVVNGTYSVDITETLTLAENIQVPGLFAASIIEGFNINLQSVTLPAMFSGFAMGAAGFGGQSTSTLLVSSQDATVVANLGSSITEAVTYADALSSIKTTFANISEGVTSADSLAAGLYYVASIIESVLTETDSESVIVTFVTSISEAMTVADAQTAITIFNSSILENINPTDVPTVKATFAKSQNEPITASDVLLAAAWIKINDTQITNWTLIDNRQ